LGRNFYFNPSSFDLKIFDINKFELKNFFLEKLYFGTFIIVILNNLTQKKFLNENIFQVLSYFGLIQALILKFFGIKNENFRKNFSGEKLNFGLILIVILK